MIKPDGVMQLIDIYAVFTICTTTKIIIIIKNNNNNNSYDGSGYQHSSEWSSVPDGLSASLIESSSEARRASPPVTIVRPRSATAGIISMLGRRSCVAAGTDRTLVGSVIAGTGTGVGASTVTCVCVVGCFD